MTNLLNQPQPRVMVVLLNYGRWADTLRCVESLQQLQYDNWKLVVIDNASPDDSLSRFYEYLAAHPNRFHLIPSPHNDGFSAGNNLGIRYALSFTDDQRVDYIWLLNNDTTVDPDALAHLVSAAETYQSLAGSLLKYPDGRFQQVGTRINVWTGKARGVPESCVTDGMELPSASGASLLIPRKALEQVGLLDERYFLYFEDTDYCLQCKARRFSIRLAAKSIVYHEEGATTGKKSLATQYYYQRNRLLLMQRFCQPVQWSTVLAYSRIRLLRLMLTARNPEKKASLRVFRLAFNDALNGVTGRCPHSLTHSD